jgi:transcription antitermination protein NusB
VGSRSRGREQAFQILFFIDLTGTAAEAAIPLFRANFKSEETESDFIQKLVLGVSNGRDELDKAIEALSKNWRLTRMSRVDRNILRLGAFELLHSTDVPPSVAMDEAIELAKKYGDENSPSFVNGILDGISRGRKKGL